MQTWWDGKWKREWKWNVNKIAICWRDFVSLSNYCSGLVVDDIDESQGLILSHTSLQGHSMHWNNPNTLTTTTIKSESLFDQLIRTEQKIYSTIASRRWITHIFVYEYLMSFFSFTRSPLNTKHIWFVYKYKFSQSKYVTFTGLVSNIQRIICWILQPNDLFRYCGNCFFFLIW